MIRRVLEEAGIRGSLDRVVFPAGASFSYITWYVFHYMSLRARPETEAAVEAKNRQPDGGWRHFAVMDLGGDAELSAFVARPFARYHQAAPDTISPIVVIRTCPPLQTCPSQVGEAYCREKPSSAKYSSASPYVSKAASRFNPA